MKSNITIPVPCNENWDAMPANGQGKFCDKCCHVVMDFAQKTNAEISDYLRSKPGERVCGRVRRDRLTISARPLLPGFFSRMKIFLAAIYFVFGGLLFTSCTNQNRPEEVMGKVEANSDTISIHDSLKNPPQTNLHGDSIHENDSLRKGQVARKIAVPKPPPMEVGIITEDFFNHDPDTTK